MKRTSLNIDTNQKWSYGGDEAYCHCIVQNGIFCCFDSVGDSSVLGDSGAAVPGGGSIVCHLRARVETMGALAGLFPSTLSSSDIMVELSFGTSWRLWMQW